MTDDQFARIFKRNTPEPTDGDWAADARHRHRRRQVGTVAVAAVAGVAVIGAPLAINVLQDNGPQYATPATSSAAPAPTASPSSGDPTGPSVSPATTAADICPAAQDYVGTDLPEGAVQLWLCGEDVEMGGRAGPPEPLTTGVDEAIATYNALEFRDPDQACTMEYTLAYTVIAEYPDGTRKAVQGELHGCRNVGDRAGGDQFFETLQDLWEGQRESTPAPELELTADEACNAPGTIMPTRPTGSVAGYLCQGTDPGAATGVELSDELLDQLLADLETRGVAGSVPFFELPPEPHLTLLNAYGEPFVLTRHTNGLYQAGELVWRPSPELAAELEALSPSGNPSPSDPSRPAMPVRDSCLDPAAIAADTPPDQADWVGICPTRDGVAEPIDALTDPALVAQAAAALTGLPGEGCWPEEVRGPVYVLFGTFDSTTAVPVYNRCGDDPMDASEVLAPILELFEQQRASDEMTSFRGGPLCPVAESVFDIDLTALEPQMGSVCVGVSESSGGVEISLPGDLLQRIATEVATATETTTTDVQGDRLILTDEYGEPLTLIRSGDGSYVWLPLDRPARSWTPSTELAAELDRYFAL